MPTAAFANLGCKVNQYEIERIAESFALHGFEIAGFDQPADVYVINTCSVTAAADRKSRQMARRAARQKPGARVVITGCFAQLAIDTAEQVEGAALLVPNSQKMRTAQHTLAAFPDLAAGCSIRPSSNSGAPGVDDIAVFPEQSTAVIGLSMAEVPRELSRTRATIKVQDGCVHFCAFCSIPYTRKTMASRPLPAVLEEVRHAAQRGIQEVVITGVCVGAYECDGAKLPDLLCAVAEVAGIERVRLSSIQPIETDDALIDVITTQPKVCKHIHLSLQSGDDTTLMQMQRPYDTAYYRDLVRRLRSGGPQIAITTDIIVGFPGESKSMFDNTCRFAEEMSFSRTHVFRYSPRQRTFAANHLSDNVCSEEKERRSRMLGEICRESQAKFARSLLGRQVEVLVEGRQGDSGVVSGYTGGYVRVNMPGDQSMVSKLVKANIVEVSEEGDCSGEIFQAGDLGSLGRGGRN